MYYESTIVQYPKLNSKVLLEATRICNGIFPTFVREVNAGFHSKLESSLSSEPLKMYVRIVEYLRSQRNSERFFSHSLMFIKQHVSLLRYSNPESPGESKLTVRDVRNCIFALEDLIVALDQYQIGQSRFDVSSILTVTIDFYTRYHTFCYQNFPAYPLPPKEFVLSSRIVIESLPPELPIEIEKLRADISRGQKYCPLGKTIRWYLNNGFENFVRTKRIVPVTGSQIPMFIVRMNESHTIVSTEDDTHRYFRNDIPIRWD